ncbi:hypothetical protein J23TS9_18600 [Paenibacillus sp. J23TS9]|uniref:hypothetical protein n=1 Tax=Paenibacillus sp. J23TS9 TaxID=2807193 RepID=UPI001B289BFE|nr:hypothetical protein [Paenibacillus sp. J23TS9]GIP26730.1 hypothetical protein J23TS9_18600 [Paenibacillus sp. J23TS9]
MIAISFALFAAFEWRQIKNKSSNHKKAFWWLFSLLLAWNTAANVIPWWPSPNRLIIYLFGWI